MRHIEVKITARYQETDRMGVIHHSVYPVWFEVARTELIKSCGHPYSELEKRGLFLPLFRLESDYIHPAFYDDSVNVSCSVHMLTKTRITLHYEIYRAKDDEEEGKKLLCEGYTHHAFTDTHLKPINITKEFPEVHEALALFCHEED